MAHAIIRYTGYLDGLCQSTSNVILKRSRREKVDHVLLGDVWSYPGMHGTGLMKHAVENHLVEVYREILVDPVRLRSERPQSRRDWVISRAVAGYTR
jgi:hypothetical protein